MAILSLGTGAHADTPVTPDASAEAQSLLAFLEDTYGKKIISGQQEGWRGTNELGFELNYIREASGKLPALLAMDVAPYTRARPARPRPARHEVVNHAVDWYANRNGIVSLCWHWSAPMNERVFYTKDTTFNPARAVIEGTPEYATTLRDIDLIAAELKLLREAHVPVLWRPLHEANGRWFWWGAGGPEPFKKLWRILFERLTVHHHLNNLIWVFSPGAAIDLGDWYPGDAYVDIIGPDHYPMDRSHGPAKGIFDEMVALGGGLKLIGFGENGPIPAPGQLVREKAGWSFFIAWSGKTLWDNNSKEQIHEAYNHPYMLNLGDLPELKKFPFASAGEAVKLAFPAVAADLAVGSPGRRPVVVAVQDAGGRTVRDGKHTVTLALDRNPGRAKLLGTLSAETVNGLAVFPDLAISKAGADFTLRASARELGSVTSSIIHVGPGAGIVRECWTNAVPAALSELSALATPPASCETLGKAFEAPVSMATNFTARYRGYLLPPLTGDYVFWIATESTSELWLSTDESATNKVKIAERTASTPYAKWPHTNEAQSAPRRLEAGRRYYVEALQKQDAGLTHFAVRWQLPNGVEERPIPGARIETPKDRDATPKLVSRREL